MTTVIIYIAAAAIIIYAIYGTLQKLKGKSKNSCCGTAEVVPESPVEDTDKSHYPFKYNLTVEGMKCSNCAANVKNAINAMGDVWATVNLGKNRAEVLAKVEKSQSDFANALRDSGYKVVSCEQVE